MSLNGWSAEKLTIGRPHLNAEKISTANLTNLDVHAASFYAIFLIIFTAGAFPLFSVFRL